MAVFLCAAAVAGCVSTNLGSKLAGEACTRSDQCVSGLSCVKGVCQSIAPGDAGDAGFQADANSADAGHELDGSFTHDDAGDDGGK
ncbi:MAG TPA: hypothetical protein VF331_02920 [Polyangiales bacterium]